MSTLKLGKQLFFSLISYTRLQLVLKKKTQAIKVQ